MAKHVLILGAGYGGICAALETRKLLTADQARITLVNRYPFHQLVTELHLPAAGSADERHVRIPLDKLVGGKKIDVYVGEVKAIHPDQNEVEMADGARLGYDVLVVGLGSETEFFGIPGLAEHSFVLKSVDDARRIREHVHACLDEYAKTKDEAAATFVVGGAGLTGIELIGELADMMPAQCRARGIDPSAIRLYSVEAMPSILPGFPEDLIQRARTSLESRGVQFITGVAVTQMEPGAVHLKDGRVIPTRTMIWTGGVRGNAVVAASGLAVERRGRALVNEFLQSQSHPNVFVVGDSAVVMNGEGRPYPPTAQISWQMGVHAGRQIYALLKGAKMERFVPHMAGTLASLGRKDAIGMVGERKWHVKGKPAAWLKEASNIRYLSKIGGLFARA
ncbi:MAG: NAD(P)/FAD-dependent oxidoreductase [Thermoflavifilum sp.]|nr:NAD(P)/FAD-dependent oxidoreductase [Thermoflavifilum sp.]MCL6513627.1 NAD(P)/FAD-dependent oxidoreductase [Alicyclobacillus sp.]